MTTELLHIPGLEILEEIGRGAYSIVYRATRNQRPFAIKVMRHLDTNRAEATLRFRREASVLARVRHPGLARVMEVGDVEKRPYLIMQYIEGETLASLLRDEAAWVESQIVYLAQTLAGALAIVHRHSLVHRDVKPSNILISDDGQPKLIDFGFAMQTSEDPQSSNVVGTFLYSAPEQTGMLRRPVDGRSDLYALGVVMYQCATGHPPFQATDISELIHKHAVIRPPDILAQNPELSPALAQIIHKLLHKDPDDRYQTGEGLLADLEQLGKLNAALNAGQDVVLGTGDDRAAALYETPLIGRDVELAELQDYWHAAMKGHGQIVNILSETGNGKSRLARELIYSAQDHGALTLMGRCIETDPVPFAPIRNAIDDLVRRLQRMPQLQRKKEEAQIKTAVGAFAPLLKEFSPILATCLDEVEAIPGLEDAHDLFFEALTHFLRELILSHGAAVLFLDDVQWLDDASLQILRHLISELRKIPLLIITTSKTLPPPLQQLADSQNIIPFRQMPLGPLDETAVSQLVATYLGNYQLDEQTINQLIVRSQGNPFAIVQYLQAMIDAGLLRPAWGNWVFDSHGLHQLQLPHDVVELMLRALTESSPQTRIVLTAAAVIGARFSLDVLMAISNLEPVAVQTAITNALDRHLLETTESNIYLFVHERIRENLLEAIDTNKKQALHQRIAETLDKDTLDDEDLYLLAHHYALGNTQKQPQRVYQTNAAAGHLARENFAYEEAISFFTQALQVAHQAHIPIDSSLTEALAAVCFRTGRLTETINYLEQALSTCEQPQQRARLWSRLAEVYLNQRNNISGWEAVHKAFAELNQSPPTVKLSGLLSTLTSWGRWWFAHTFQHTNHHATGAEAESLRILTKLYQIATYMGYMGSDPRVLAQLALRPLYPAHKLGPSRELVAAYGSYAVLLAVLQRPNNSTRMAQRAVDIAKTLDDRTSLGHGLYLQAMTQHINGDSITAEQSAIYCIEQYGRWLNSFHYSVICGDLTLNLIIRGYFRKALIWANRIRDRLILTAGEATQETLFLPYLGTILITLGRNLEGHPYLQQARDSLDLNLHDTYRWGLYLEYQTLAYLELGELGDALEEIFNHHQRLNLKPNRMTFQLRFFYVFQAYARLLQAVQATEPDDKATTLTHLNTAVSQLEAATTTDVLQSHLLVVQAMQHHLTNDSTQALERLTQAEGMAVRADVPWVLYEVARWRAVILKARQQQNMAEQQARIAYNIAVTHGWTHRVRHIRIQHHIHDILPMMSQSVNTSTSITSQSHSSTGGSTGSLRLQRYLDSLLQVSLASAATLNPEAQAQAALDELVRILGAEHAFLFLVDDETNTLTFMAGRDAHLNDLKATSGYSQTVVEQVHLTHKPMILSGTEEGLLIGADSVVAQDIRSIIAAPLLLRETLIGVVYLDNRLVQGVFTQEDVRILLAVANHIAIALDTAHMIDVIRDRTEALTTAYTQLERLDRTKSDFISILSHELRTPLTVLDGYCQLLLHDEAIKTNPFRTQLVEGINKGADRLHDIINSMLDMAKLDSSSLQMVLTEVSLPVLLELIVKKFNTALNERNITLDLHLPSLQALSVVQADPDLLRKVFQQLIINAIKYTPDGGRITISGQPTTEDTVKLIINDTGIGIDPKYHDLIFTKFYQTGEVALHSSGKTKFKGGGPGLGLTIAKGIIEAHGGQIWVESPGHDEDTFPGSDFHILLPTHPPAIG